MASRARAVSVIVVLPTQLAPAITGTQCLVLRDCPPYLRQHGASPARPRKPHQSKRHQGSNESTGCSSVPFRNAVRWEAEATAVPAEQSSRALPARTGRDAARSNAASPPWRSAPQRLLRPPLRIAPYSDGVGPPDGTTYPWRSPTRPVDSSVRGSPDPGRCGRGQGESVASVAAVSGSAPRRDAPGRPPSPRTARHSPRSGWMSAVPARPPRGSVSVHWVQPAQAARASRPLGGVRTRPALVRCPLAPASVVG